MSNVRKVTALVMLGFWFSAAGAMRAQDDQAVRIWKEFMTDLRAGAMENPERFRLLDPAWTQTVLGWLRDLRETIVWDKTGTTPEVFRVGDELRYVIPVVQIIEGQTTEPTYCFTLLVESNHWYFRHLESIAIRLDKVKDLPASEFPDVPEETKAWIRNEIRTSDDIRLFNFLAKEKGKVFAYAWFKDGPGYVVAANAWVPFYAPRRAFILYTCWHLANLRGENVTLEKLDEKEALIHWRRPLFFELYKRSSHIREWISVEDYRRLFETIWQDRARAAGWNLALTEEGDGVAMHFTPGWLQQSMPVVKLPTRRGGEDIPEPSYPSSISPYLPDDLVARLSAYGAAGHIVFGPKGWSGDGLISADGNVTIRLHPASGFSEVGPRILIFIASTGTGRALMEAAPYSPWVRDHWTELGMPDEPPGPLEGLQTQSLTPHLKRYVLPATAEGLRVQGLIFSDAEDHLKDGMWAFMKMEAVFPPSQTELAERLLEFFINARDLKKK